MTDRMPVVKTTIPLLLPNIFVPFMFLHVYLMSYLKTMETSHLEQAGLAPDCVLLFDNYAAVLFNRGMSKKYYFAR